MRKYAQMEKCIIYSVYNWKNPTISRIFFHQFSFYNYKLAGFITCMFQWDKKKNPCCALMTKCICTLSSRKVIALTQILALDLLHNKSKHRISILLCNFIFSFLLSAFQNSNSSNEVNCQKGTYSALPIHLLIYWEIYYSNRLKLGKYKGKKRKNGFHLLKFTIN